jgi:hypothetical protein
MDFEPAGIGGASDSHGRAEGVAGHELRSTVENVPVDSCAAGGRIGLKPREDMIRGLHGWLAFEPSWRTVRA